MWLAASNLPAMSTIAPSDIYPAVRRFLVDCGLNRALKAHVGLIVSITGTGGSEGRRTWVVSSA